MAYIPDSDFTYETNFNYQLDAFGRLRTSNPGQRLDVEFIYTTQPDYYDLVSGSVGGSATLNSTSRDLNLNVDNNISGSYAKISSYPVPYTPGNSQLIDLTGVLNAGNTSSGSAEIFLRSSVTGTVMEEIVSQSQWLNYADGGIDWSNSHIFSMDFQSLRVGTIRYGLVQNGAFVPLYQLNNDNKRSTGYWQIPNLPIYYKVYNDNTFSYSEIGYGNESNGIGFRYKTPVTGSASVKGICASVKSEGGDNLQNMAGIPRTVDTGVASTTVSTTLIPLLSIRVKELFNGVENLTISTPKGFTVTADNPIKLSLILNPTLTGADWQPVDALESAVEYDITATAISNGTTIFSEYISTDRNTAEQVRRLLGKLVLFHRKSNISGILSIAAIRTINADAECRAIFDWEELGR